jgi:hypothetical protein
MVYANIICPREGPFGQLQFFYCPISKKIFLMCDECSSIWLDPLILNIQIDFPYAENPKISQSPSEVFIRELGCCLAETREATKEEIIQYGWADYIREE